MQDNSIWHDGVGRRNQFIAGDSTCDPTSYDDAPETIALYVDRVRRRLAQNRCRNGACSVLVHKGRQLNHTHKVSMVQINALLYRELSPIPAALDG